MSRFILVVDDEPAIRELLRFHLTKDGFEVVTAADGREALKLAREHRPDLILLDLMLPDVDGFELCRTLRAESTVPIVMLTARKEDVDKILGLELGADDYVTKPFNPREIVARVKAVLRRLNNPQDLADRELLQAGRLSMNLGSHEVLLHGNPIPLSRTEFELLKVLLLHKNRVLSRDVLLDRVWGADYVGDSRVVDVYIRYLREKLEDDPAHPAHIETVRGVGYRFKEA